VHIINGVKHVVRCPTLGGVSEESEGEDDVLFDAAFRFVGPNHNLQQQVLNDNLVSRVCHVIV
jgi:hypothetical protein